MSGLPEGWAAATLDDLGDYLNGMAFKPEDWTGTGFPIIRIQNLTNPDRPLNRTERAFDNRYLVRAGDLLISWSATLDAFLWEREDAILNQHIFKVTPSSAADPKFLFYASRQAIADLVSSDHLHGSTMKHINRGPFLAHELGLPPLAEQRRIVAKLDALTARTARARADLDRIPVLAARYKQAVLAKAFSGELTAEWRSSHGLPEPRMTRLADLVAEPVRNGLSVRGSDEPPGIRSLRLSALRGGAVNLDDVRFLPISDDRARRFLLRDGDILVSRGNGTKTLVGISALVGHVREPTIFPDTAFRIRVAQDRVDPQWLSHIWSAPQARTQIEAVAKTTAGIWKVSQADLAGVELPFFELSEQIEIVRRLGHALAEIDRLVVEASAARRLLDRLDQAILTKAFQGELVPQDPADEPASVLLDRIRAERASAPKATRGRRKAVA